MEKKLDLILIELQKLNGRVTNLEHNMSTKDDVADIRLIKPAVIETNQDVKLILDDLKSIHEILGEYEISIRTFKT